MPPTLKRLALLLAPGLMLPSLAMGDTLRLPSEARLDVQVVDTLSLSQATPSQANVLLKPATGRRSGDSPSNADGQEAAHALPSHCLITADARLVEGRIRLSANSLTCIGLMGDAREIYSGKLSAAAREANGDFGVEATCTASNEQGCQSVELRPAHAFQLELGQALAIEAQDNPSRRLNEQRLHADEAPAQ
ncbi:MAG: hypothetical protein CME72_02720 [Halomonadaceae bacterium]|jgi:hypothetical protein|nr:hypothetical protein [Halomonadaceae bacterium]